MLIALNAYEFIGFLNAIRRECPVREQGLHAFVDADKCAAMTRRNRGTGGGVEIVFSEEGQLRQRS